MSALPRFAHLTAVLAVLAVSACSAATSTLDYLSDPREAPRSFTIGSGPDDSPDPQVVPRSRTRCYDRVYVAVYIAALNAASLLSWEVEVLDPEAGVIQVRTPGGLWNDGDKVTVRVARRDSASTMVDLWLDKDRAIDRRRAETSARRFFERLDAGLGKPAGT